MKFVKKLTALFLAVVMAMAMGITAFADGATTVTGPFTIMGPKDGHTYEVYQVLTGDVTTEGVLSNPAGGKNFKYSSTTLTDAQKKSEAEAAVKALTGKDKTQATADAVAAYVTFSDPIATLNDDNSTASVAPGYYLIKDTGKTSGTTDSYSTYIAMVVKADMESGFTVKRQTPTFEKKVKDTNDSEANSTTGWQDSADYDIGDAVPFQLKGTIPSNYGDYKTYYYQFTDQMEKSLSFDKSSVKVYVDGKEIATGFNVSDGSTVTSDDSFNGGTKFTVTFDDLKRVDAVKAGSTITVEFNATLNENAVLGSTGNVNEGKLSYSNNPNSDGSGNKGETPWDQVIVFTYKVIVNKVDPDQQPLTGAQFTLYKKLATGGETTITSVEIAADQTATPSTFNFKGLDDGDYVLRETKTPTGYNTIADIEFTITATHNVEWANGVDRTTILSELKGGSLGDGAVNTGAITTTVENHKGSTLPSTGGMGTTVIYIAGIAMIMVAGVAVIVRKRMA